MLKHWWKILGALLLLSAIIFGLKTPLSSGISGVSEYQLNPGKNTIIVSGYNTNFNSEDASLISWLKSEEQLICAETSVIDDHQLRLNINLSGATQSNSLDLFVYSNSTDTITLPFAFQYTPDEGIALMESCSVITDNYANPPYAFPYREILYETIRNLFLHVPMWFTMMVILLIGFINSIKYLSSSNPLHDIIAQEAVKVGLLFGILGLITGAIWAKFTWGSWWVFQDIKLNGAAISTLMYLAYMVLRNSIDDEHKRAKVSAVYNIFAYIMFIVFIMVIPRLKGSESLHPGNGGNPAFSNYDLDSSLRAIFYPAVAGWILLGAWFLSIRIRLEKIKSKLD